MTITLPLARMTTSDKLRALEKIWDDLSRTSENVPSPSWHADVLKARQKRLQNGSAHFTEWTEAKRVIRNRVK
ncbi:MAG: addiction module protein [Kiritimatiellia bacterium]